MVISTARYWQKTISDFNKNCGPDSTRFGPLRSIFRVNIRSSPAIFPHLPDLGLNRPFEGGIWPFQRPGTRKTPFSTFIILLALFLPIWPAQVDFQGQNTLMSPIWVNTPPVSCADSISAFFENLIRIDGEKNYQDSKNTKKKTHYSLLYGSTKGIV